MSKEFIKKGTTKKHFKNLFLLAFIITGILVVSSLGGADVSADDSAVYQVTIDKELVKFNDDLGFPKLINQRTLVPLRVISENMGYDVGWNQENQTATIENSKTKVSIKVASNVAIVNGKEVILDTSAMLLNTGNKAGVRTYVPLRFVSEAMGAHVGYKNVNGVHHIAITTGGIEEEEEKEDEKDVEVSFPEPEFRTRQFKGVPYSYEYYLITIDNLKDYEGMNLRVSTKLTNWDEIVEYRNEKPIGDGYFKVNMNDFYSNLSESSIRNHRGIYKVTKSITDGLHLTENRSPKFPPEGYILKHEVTIEAGGEKKTYHVDVPFQHRDFNY